MIEINFYAFVNFKQNIWAKLLSMAKFEYNIAKNGSTNNLLAKLNYNYHPRIFFKKIPTFALNSQ